MALWYVYKWLPNGEQYYVATIYMRSTSEKLEIEELLTNLESKNLECDLTGRIGDNIYELHCGDEIYFAERTL